MTLTALRPTVTNRDLSVPGHRVRSLTSDLVRSRLLASLHQKSHTPKNGHASERQGSR